MSSHPPFPSLEGWESTKATLHLYSQAVGVVPRVHAPAHPKWWHVSLKVRPEGLVTDEMPFPGGGTFGLRMDLRRHKVVLSSSEGFVREFDMLAGLTATEFGDRMLDAVAELGLEGKYLRERYQNDDARHYDPEMAERYFTAVSSANRVFQQHRATLSGDVGQVQLWPHGFDLAVEWFGTRVETYEEHGKVTEYPSQLNLGFSPGDSETGPYFYSNPWPFEADKLLDKPLPAGARWFTESWQGSIMPYSELVDDDDAEARLLAYAKAVFEISSPTLIA